MIFAWKINKIHEFYMIFARKVPKFYIIIAQKYFPRFFFWGGGGDHAPPDPPSPTPMRQSNFITLTGNIKGSQK